MSIKKVTIASLILLSLAACSSGSGSSQHGTEKKSTPSIQESNKQNNNNQSSKSEAERLKAEEAARLAKEKAEAERLKAEEVARLAKEKAEAERLKAEEAARLAKEKTGEERLKAEEAARLAKEKAEAERLKAEEAARLAKEKAEAERLKTEEAAHLAKEKAEAERLKAEEAARLAKEKAEAERLKAEEAARLAKEKAEAERLAKETTIEQKLKELNVPEKDIQTINDESFSNDQKERFLSAVRRMKELDIEYNYIFAHNHANGSQDRENNTSLEEILRAERAYLLGVEGENARRFAESYSVYSDKETKEEIDNKLANFLKGIQENQYISGLNRSEGKLIYNQKYSITTIPKNDGYIHPQYDEIITKGLETKAERIPDEGKATYIGKAYGAFNTNGELNYSVDFSKRVGKGKITGMEHFKDNIILEEGTIQDNRVVSSTRTGSEAVGANKNSELNRYEIKFFGPKAEEIGGKATLGDYNLGLAGTRGEITK